MSAANRVILNTIILYVKMLITMGITLYSTRLVLNALGASDYGIFNLIAGVIAMLSFLNAAMTISTQRYLSFHQGTGDFEMQKKVFINSWILHIAIGLIVVLLLLSLAPFLFGGFLNIPEDRIFVAETLYYFMAVSVFFTIMSVPFTASLNAHENMLWIAVVNIVESVIKLGIAFSLIWFIQSERLIVYGILMAILSLITFFLYAAYCLKKYDECSVRNYKIDRSLTKELGAFSSWIIVGAVSSVGRNQGLAVILNIFFGTIVNAAYGIANQVAAQMQFLSTTLLRALNPQIMKSEGMCDRQRMLRLSMIASKFGFFLVAIIAIPCIFEMPVILELWLKHVPENAIAFCSWILLTTLVTQLTIGLQSAVLAVGKLKKYQIIIGGLQFLNVPLAYLLLKIGLPAYSVLISYFSIEVVNAMSRLIFAKMYAGLSIIEYINVVLLKEIIPILISIFICYLIVNSIESEFRFLLTISFSSMAFCISIYIFGLCKDEKEMLNSILKKVLLKVKIKL